MFRSETVLVWSREGIFVDRNNSRDSRTFATGQRSEIGR